MPDPVKRRFRSILVSAVVAACSSAPRPETTSIAQANCTEPPNDVTARFAGAGLSGQQCPGIQGWQVFVVSSNANDWLELHAAGRSWSFEQQLVRVARDRALEWRVDTRRGPTAVIATVVADTPDRQGLLSQFFVIRLDGTRNACVIGREAMLDAARAAADGEGTCQ